MRVTGVEGNDAAHYPLSLVASGDARLHLKFEYLPDLFDRDSVEDIARTGACGCSTPRRRSRPAAGPDVDCSTERERARAGAGARRVPAGSVRTLPQIFDGRRRAGSERDRADVRATATVATANSTSAPTGSRACSIARGAGPGDVRGAGHSTVDRVGARGLGGGQDRCRIRAGRPELPDGAHRAHAHRFRCHPRTDHGRARDRLPDTAPWLRSTTPSSQTDCAETSGAAGDRRRPDGRRSRLDTAAYIVYTSGSTGSAQGRRRHPPRARQLRRRPARAFRRRRRRPGPCTSRRRVSTGRCSSTCRPSGPARRW